MHSILFIFIFLFSGQVLYQNLSEAEGYWTGFIDVYGTELGIYITFTFSDNELDGAINIPQQQAYHLPVEVIEHSENSIVFQFQTGTGPATFYGEWLAEENIIEGEFEQVGERFPFRITKADTSNGRDAKLPETELIIPTRAGQISGSLILHEIPEPMVVLLSGSGAQNRDENVAGFPVFGELSEKLYSAGYSTFRFDDRGIGESEGERDATLHELAEDVEDIVDYLQKHYAGKFTKIYLLGHSQGGLVASIASQNLNVDGLIFMAAPFLRGDEIINEQIILISKDRDVPERIVQQNLEFQSRIYDVVRNNGEWEEIEMDLSLRLEEQINQLPDQQRNALGDMSSFIKSQVDRQLSAAKSRWFKSLIEFEPVEVIQQLEIPILALFGEKDMQVPTSSNHNVSGKLREEQEMQISTVVIPGANHLFQPANTGMPGEYGMLERTFADGFLSTITDWLSEN